MNKKEKFKEKIVEEDSIWGREKDVANLKKGTGTSEESKLYRLAELKDYEIGNDDPDVRGWGVYDVTNRKLGKVEELVVDQKALKVRYLIINFDNLEGKEGENHRLLIPIGQANLDENQDRVYLRNLGPKRLKNLPIYTGKPVTRDFESLIRQNISDNETLEERPLNEFYEHDDFNEHLFYGSRRTHKSSAENSKFKSKF
jgi:photosynthetic reaction center H subunit